MRDTLKTTKKVTRKDLQTTGIVVIVLLLGLCMVLGGGVAFFGNSETPAEEPTNQDEGTVAGEEVVEEEPQRTAYSVTEIVDGDTIKINYNEKVEKVRLIGIDTPESKDTRTQVECFAKESSDKLSELLNGKSVFIEFDESQEETDKYDRLLLYVWRSDDELFVNDHMVREGFAHEYTYDSPYKYQEQFKQAQKEAEDNNRGLWGDACACEEGKEKSRECVGCKKAKVTYSHWDCSTYTETITDNSCTSDCYVAPTPAPTPKPDPTPKPKPSYTCDCSKTCPEMSSCAEAYYQLNTCGCSVRDGDNDGVPCEDICPGGI